MAKDKEFGAAEFGAFKAQVEAAGVPWAKFLQALPILLRLWESADVKALIALFAANEPAPEPTNGGSGVV